MTVSNSDRLQAVHEEALRAFDKIQLAQRGERMQCLEDRRFYSIPGAQWEGPLGEQFENKPRLEFNMVHLAVIRIINEYRNNRITVDFTPKDGQPSEMADTCDGLYRADEQDSGAQEAYDNCFEEGVGGGIGALRLRADYEDPEDDDNEKQRVCIEPIFDADSCVFFDLDAKRQDKKDAKMCFVLEGMTHAAFEEEFGHPPSTWPKTVQRRYFDWYTPDLVYVAHYYRVEQTKKLVHVFRGLDDVDMMVPDEELKADEDKLPTLLATGFREVRQKRISTTRVRKYILSGLQVEDDEGYIAGKCIPVVPFFGKRWWVDGLERTMGHVRLAKDAQRLMNSLLSWLTDIASRFDIEKPILTPEQIQGHATMWAQDNIQKYPYLLSNNMRDADGNPIPGSNAPVGYTKAPQIPPVMAALMQIAQQALQDLLGNQQAGEQLQPNLSGKAVELIQQRLDMQVFIYMSNFAKTMKRCGEIWLSMMKDIVVENERAMKTVAKDGQVGSVTLQKPAYDPATGQETVENDITTASLDVWSDVGPSSTSQRSATVRALSGLASITEDPQTKQALMLATIANIEGEGLGDLRDWARKQAVQMGIVKPTEEEEQEMAQAQQSQAQQPPDPQTQFLLASASSAAAKAGQLKAQTIDTLADAMLKDAQADKFRAETEATQGDSMRDSLSLLHDLTLTPGGPA